MPMAEIRLAVLFGNACHPARPCSSLLPTNFLGFSAQDVLVLSNTVAGRRRNPYQEVELGIIPYKVINLRFITIYGVIIGSLSAVL